jgi:hypothetical protein
MTFTIGFSSLKFRRQKTKIAPNGGAATKRRSKRPAIALASP